MIAARGNVPVVAKSRIVLACLVLVAAVWGIYAQVAGHEFVRFDDYELIAENELVRSGLTADGVREALVSAHVMYWHPLSTLSLMADAEFQGMEAGGFLVTNALLHAAAGCALFLALLALTGRFWPAFLAAALFAVHPQRVESVAWATERKDVLSGLFLMLVLLAWAGYARRPSAWRYAGVALLFALGLMAKPGLVPLPVGLFLLDFWPLGRIAGRWGAHGERAEAEGSGGVPRVTLARAVLEKVPLLLLSAASVVVTGLSQKSVFDERAFDLVAPAARVANFFVSCASYLGKLAWPADLAFFYPHPVLVDPDYAPWTGAAVAAGILVAALTASAFFLRRRLPYLAFGWFWFLVMLSPMSGLTQVGGQALADRFTYVPMVGVCVAIVWAGAALGRRFSAARLPLALLAALTLPAYAFQAWRQTKTWRDSESLFEHALAVTERNYIAHANLGEELLRRGELDRAREHLEAAVAIRADLHVAFNNLGLVHGREGRHGEARRAFEAALAASPRYAEAHNNLGVSLEQLGELEGAVRHYRAALEHGPPLPNVTSNLAWLLATAPDPALRAPAEAVGLAQQALRDSGGGTPRYAEVLAASLAATGDYARAVELQRQVVGALSGRAKRAAERRLALYASGRPFVLGAE